MDKPEVALVRRYFASFNAGDAQGMLDCLADVVLHDVNEGERRRGRALFGTFLQHMERCYREQLKDIVIMSGDAAGRVSAEYVVHGVYVATDEGLPPAKGQGYVLPAGSFFEVSDGKISRVTTYYNLRNWIRQVGG